jgi:hypothetical protein
MNEPGLQKLERQALDMPSETAIERARRDRDDNPGVNQPLDYRSISLERWTALGMREYDAIATLLQSEDNGVETGHHCCEWWLDQQPLTVAERESRQLGRRDVANARHRYFGACLDVDLDPVGAESQAEVMDQSRDGIGSIGVLPADVRGRHELAGAGGRCGGYQRHGVLNGSRAVVDPRQDVAVEVDHDDA